MNGKEEVEAESVQNLSSGANGFAGSTMFEGGGCFVSINSVPTARKVAFRFPDISSNPSKSTEIAPIPIDLRDLMRSFSSTVILT
jgi:hypothetical protein